MATAATAIVAKSALVVSSSTSSLSASSSPLSSSHIVPGGVLLAAAAAGSLATAVSSSSNATYLVAATSRTSSRRSAAASTSSSRNAVSVPCGGARDAVASPMHSSGTSSSAVGSTSTKSSNSQGSGTGAALKGAQRKHKDEASGSKSSPSSSRGLKWKVGHNNPTEVLATVDDDDERNTKCVSSRATKIPSSVSKANNPSAFANLHRMQGQLWGEFMESYPDSDEDEEMAGEIAWRRRHIRDRGTINRLDRIDMNLYALCPETDPFYAVICDICNSVAKPQGLRQHMLHRHHGSAHSSSSHSSVVASATARSSASTTASTSASSSLSSSAAAAAASSSSSLWPPLAADSHGLVTTGAGTTNSQGSTAAVSTSCPSTSNTSSSAGGRSTDKTTGGGGTSRSGHGHHENSPHLVATVHSSSSSPSSSSKSKSKSTSKVKSKSRKSGNNSSSHSLSAAPSPSSSSSSASSFSIGSGSTRNASGAGAVVGSSVVAIEPASNGVASSGALSPVTIANAVNSPLSRASSASTGPGQQTNNKPSKTPMGGYAASATMPSSTSSSPFDLRPSVSSTVGGPKVTTSSCSTTEVAAVSSSSSSSVTSSNSNCSVSSSTSSSSSSSSCSSSSSSAASTAGVAAGSSAPAANATASSTTPRRTYARCKSSSVERKNVPVKEREYDANKHCGVISADSARPCTRSLTCKAHSLSMRRLVSGRSKSFDKLLADQRSAREQPQSSTKPRTILELESSNSSSSLDHGSVSSNSNLSVEVQASSTASSQSSVVAPIVASSATVETTLKMSTTPPVAIVTAASSTTTNTTAPLSKVNLQAALAPTTTTTMSTCSVTTTMDSQDAVAVSEFSPLTMMNGEMLDASTQLFGSGRHQQPSLRRRRSCDELSPVQSSGDQGATTPLTTDDGDADEAGPSKRLRENNSDTTVEDERQLFLMVQQKVAQKNKMLFRNPNAPTGTATEATMQVADGELDGLPPWIIAPTQFDSTSGSEVVSELPEGWYGAPPEPVPTYTDETCATTTNPPCIGLMPTATVPSSDEPRYHIVQYNPMAGFLESSCNTTASPLATACGISGPDLNPETASTKWISQVNAVNQSYLPNDVAQLSATTIMDDTSFIDEWAPMLSGSETLSQLPGCDERLGHIEMLSPARSRPTNDDSTAAASAASSSSSNEKENSMFEEMTGTGSSSPVYYYGRLPKPVHVNTFGLVKMRGATHFRKTILATRRQFFRRDDALIKQLDNCATESYQKIGATNSPGGGRNNSTAIGASAGPAGTLKNAKQTRRQNSANHSPVAGGGSGGGIGVCGGAGSQILKRQSVNFMATTASMQTASPFYKRYNVASAAAAKVRLHKRSVIMVPRVASAGQPNLSKTCAILQSQIVHKLAEQLLGFKKSAGSLAPASAKGGQTASAKQQQQRQQQQQSQSAAAQQSQHINNKNSAFQIAAQPAAAAAAGSISTPSAAHIDSEAIRAMPYVQRSLANKVTTTPTPTTNNNSNHRIISNPPHYPTTASARYSVNVQQQSSQSQSNSPHAAPPMIVMSAIPTAAAAATTNRNSNIMGGRRVAMLAPTLANATSQTQNSSNAVPNASRNNGQIVRIAKNTTKI